MSTQQKPQTPAQKNNNSNQKQQKPQTPPAQKQEKAPVAAQTTKSEQPKPQNQKQTQKPQNQQPAQTKPASTSVVVEATTTNSSPSPAKAASSEQAPKQFPAVVKSVLSGDTLVLVHPEKGIEKTVTLASIKTPSLARKGKEGKQQEEQPFAFAAREFIRKKVIGKKVDFQWTYKNASGRDYGNVFLSETRENLAISLLREGLAEVIKKDGKSAEAEDYKKLLNIQQQAQDDQKGKWTEDKQTIQKNTRKINEKSNGETVFRNLKGKPVSVVVEYVINGSTMKVYIPQTNDLVLMNLTGIKCPGFVKEAKKEGSEAPKTVAKPFAQEALAFTESRLLHRDVTVIIEGGASDAVHGTIVKPGVTNFEAVQGPVTFQEDLLARGLAQTVSFNNGASKFLARFKVAENEAKAKKLRVFQGYTEKPSSLKEEDRQEMHVRVLDVISGDTIRVVKSTGQEEKISLSNVRAPKPGNRNGEGAEEYAPEAKDVLRKKLAGKKITARVDYRKEFGGKKEEKEGAQVVQKEDKRPPEVRKFCTVLADGKNVGVELVTTGYAKVVGSGEERSPFFDQLKNAEADAKQHKRGIHGGSKKNQGVTHMNDLTSAKGGQAQQFIRILKDKKTRAVVEKVYSGTRFKLSLPKDYVIVNFALRNIIAPALKSRQGPAEPRPFAKESLYYAIDNVGLKDVEIEIEDLDKFGNFAGQIFVNGESFGAKILKEGLAKTSKSAAQLKYSAELLKNEEEAKKASKNIWSIKEEPQQRRERISKLKVKPEAKVTFARVTYVADADTFYFQTSKAAAELAAVEEIVSKIPDTPATIEVGQLVLAPYGEEPGLYRGKITKVNEDGTAVVQYIDFGNSETLETSTLKGGVTEELAAIKPQAREGKLAFVVPHATNYRSDATSYLKEVTADRDLKARSEYSEDKQGYYTLYDPQESLSINAQLVANGLMFVSRPQEVLRQKASLQSIVEKLEEEEKKAKNDHLNLWEEGDIYGDEDDE